MSQKKCLQCAGEHYAKGLCFNCYMRMWNKKNSEKRKINDRKYREENRERRRQQALEYYHDKREKNLETKRKYRKSNSEKIRVANHEWYERNKEYMSRYRKQYYPKYYSENKESILHKTANNRIRRRGATGSHTNEEWNKIRRESPICTMCGRFVGSENMTKDHIIPLKKGGSNYIDNIQALCGSCNSGKRDRV